VDTIILTSEDRRYVDARHDFTDRGFRFIVNPSDVMPGTGDPRMMREGKDAAFLSLLTALHLQARAQYYVLNCDSNFHQMMRKVVLHGGGFVLKPQVFCMHNQVGASGHTQTHTYVLWKYVGTQQTDVYILHTTIPQTNIADI
jgi:hypothetical protein